MFYIIVCSLVVISFVYNALLSHLNRKSVKRGIPENVKEIYDETTYKKWLSYKHDKSKLSFINLIVHSIIILVLFTTKAFSFFVSVLPGDDVMMQTLWVILVYEVAFIIPGIIFRYIDIMKIEEKYGFNKTNKKTFVVDTIKSIFFECFITLGLIEFFAILHIEFGIWTLVIFTAIVFAFLIFVFMFNSKFARLNNKFVNLEEGSLRTKLEKLLTDNGYKVKEIVVMDGSKRSTKANAYFTGLGKFKSIVLYDTLLDIMSENEIVAVFAHELGHGKHKDTTKNLFTSLLNIVIIVVLVWLATFCKGLFTDFGFNELNYGFIYIILAEVVFDFIMPLIGLFTNHLSRKYEYAADRFACEQGYGRYLITGLKKLSRNNLADLNPHPLIVKLSYSHPPMSDRIEAINKLLTKDKMCFTINQLRSREEIESYYSLFDQKLFSGVEFFYPIHTKDGQFEEYTSSMENLFKKYSYLERVLHLPHGKRYSICDLDNYLENVQILKDAVDYAAKFNVTKLTLHLGWFNNEINRDEIIQHCIKVTKELTIYAGKYNMKLMIENMPSDIELGYSPEEILFIIKEVNEDNLKFIFDTGHAHVSEYEDTEYLTLLKDYLYHIHYSDNDSISDKHARLGSGTINFTKHFDVLDDIKYNQLHCLEIIYKTKEDLELYLKDFETKKIEIQ